MKAGAAFLILATWNSEFYLKRGSNWAKQSAIIRFDYLELSTNATTLKRVALTYVYLLFRRKCSFTPGFLRKPTDAEAEAEAAAKTAAPTAWLYSHEATI